MQCKAAGNFRPCASMQGGGAHAKQLTFSRAIKVAAVTEISSAACIAASSTVVLPRSVWSQTKAAVALAAWHCMVNIRPVHCGTELRSWNLPSVLLLGYTLN